MAVSKKGKRKIEIEGRLYLWNVIDKYDQSHFDGVQATVTAETGGMNCRLSFDGQRSTNDSALAVRVVGRSVLER